MTTPADDPRADERTQRPIPLPSERAAMLRKVYRFFRLYGAVSELDWMMYETAIAELTGLGYTLTADEIDWQPPQEAHDGQ